MKKKSELNYEIREKMKLKMLKNRMSSHIANSNKSCAFLGHGGGHRSQSEKKRPKKKLSS